MQDLKHRKITLAAAAALVLVVAVACGKKDTITGTVVVTDTSAKIPQLPKNTTVNFTATMTGAKENPANTSTATGTFTATLDTATNLFTYDFTYTGLTSPVSNGHIHGPAASATVNAGTSINFNTWPGASFTGFGSATSGSGHGLALLTAGTQITATINGDSLKKLLLAGLTYANIHTTQNAGGEVRGTITKQ